MTHQPIRIVILLALVAGAVPLTDLLDTQLDLTAARARNVQARWSGQQSGASLLRAVGSLAEANEVVK